MAKLWRYGFPGFVEGEMNRWSMKDFEDSEKSLYDSVIIDIIIESLYICSNLYNVQEPACNAGNLGLDP